MPDNQSSEADYGDYQVYEEAVHWLMSGEPRHLKAESESLGVSLKYPQTPLIVL